MTLVQQLKRKQEADIRSPVQVRIDNAQYVKKVNKAINDFRVNKLNDGYTQTGNDEYVKVTREGNDTVTETVVLDPRTLEINISTKTVTKPVVSDVVDSSYDKIKNYERKIRRIRERGSPFNNKSKSEAIAHYERQIEQEKRKYWGLPSLAEESKEISDSKSLIVNNNSKVLFTPVPKEELLYTPVPKYDLETVAPSGTRFSYGDNISVEPYVDKKLFRESFVEPVNYLSITPPHIAKQMEFEKDWEKFTNFFGEGNYEFFRNMERNMYEGAIASDVSKLFKAPTDLAHKGYDWAVAPAGWVFNKASGTWIRPVSDFTHGLTVDTGKTVLIDYPLYAPQYTATKIAGETLGSGGRNIYMMLRNLFSPDTASFRDWGHAVGTTVVAPKGYKKVQEGIYGDPKTVRDIKKSLNAEELAQFEARLKATKESSKADVKPQRDLDFFEMEGMSKNVNKALEEWYDAWKNDLEVFGSLGEKSQVKLKGKSGDIDVAASNKILHPKWKEMIVKDLWNRMEKYAPDEMVNYKLKRKGIDKQVDGVFDHFMEIKPEARLDAFFKRMEPTTLPSGGRVMSINEAVWRKLIGTYERGRQRLGSDWVNPEMNKDLRRYMEISEQLMDARVKDVKGASLFPELQKRAADIMRKNYELAETGKSSVTVKNLKVRDLKPVNFVNMMSKLKEGGYTSLGKKASSIVRDSGKFREYLKKLNEPYYMKDLRPFYSSSYPEASNYPVKGVYPSSYGYPSSSSYPSVPSYPNAPSIPYYPVPYAPDVPVAKYPVSKPYNYPPVVDNKIISVPSPVPFDDPEEVVRRVHSDEEDGSVPSWRAVLLDELNREFSLGDYDSLMGAEGEGMRAVDELPLSKFQVRRSRTDPRLVKKGRKYRKVFKFKKQKDTYVERKYYRFDTKNERSGSFNVSPYVFAT